MRSFSMRHSGKTLSSGKRADRPRYRIAGTPRPRRRWWTQPRQMLLRTSGRSLTGVFPDGFHRMDLQRLQRGSTLAAIKAAPGNDDDRSDDRVVETSIPFRLDGLRWSGFHTRVVIALGITWILEGVGGPLPGRRSER